MTANEQEDFKPTVEDLMLAQKVIMASHKQLMKEWSDGDLGQNQDPEIFRLKESLLVAHATLMLF